MAMTPLRETLESLQTAEEFLDHFAIAYDQHVVDVCRLHILKRAHDYLQDRGVQSLDDAALHGAFAMYTILRREAFSDTTFLWEVLAPDVAQLGRSPASS
jgi:nitrogenase-stabilizing/protective protein